MKTTAEKLRQCEITLYGYLVGHAAAAGDRPFLIDENRTLTYREALRTVDSLAADFARGGMKKGDVVALRATRSPETVLLTLALCSLGGIAVMTDPHFPVREYIGQSGVEIYPAFFLTDETGVWSLTGKNGAREVSFVAGDTAAAADGKAAPDDPFMIIFTSGSTGKSKAVTLSHRNCVGNPVDAMPLFEENENDVAAALLPLHHVFGFAVISCAVFCGHPVVFPDDLSADGTLRTVAKYGVSVIYAVPTFFLDLLASGRHRNYDISSLRLGLMAGGPFTAEQMRFIESSLGLRLMPGYGMSECVGISTMRYRDGVEERAAGVGRPYPMTEVFILDESGNAADVGTEGEICVRGTTLMLGYYNDKAATDAAVDACGRLHTGDLGYMDADGILHVSGRKKDIIIRGGENIAAVKIERALLALDGVYQAAVVGVKDERYGEIPCAAVIPVGGAVLTEERLKAALAATLSKHEIPVRIAITAEFPKVSSGKTDKARIKEMFRWKA